MLRSLTKLIPHALKRTIPTRLKIGFMLFSGSFMIFMLRSNFSIIIIAMKDTYRWSNYEQNLLLSAYFCGYVGPNLIAGMLAERFGGKILIFVVFLLSSIITALSPLTASDNFEYMFWARLLLGVCGVSMTRRSAVVNIINSRFQGILLLHVPQPDLAVGAADGKGQIRVESARLEARHGCHLAFDGSDNRCVRLAMGLLRYCAAVAHRGGDVVSDCRKFARKTSDDKQSRARLHR